MKLVSLASNEVSSCPLAELPCGWACAGGKGVRQCSCGVRLVLKFNLSVKPLNSGLR